MVDYIPFVISVIVITAKLPSAVSVCVQYSASGISYYRIPINGICPPIIPTPSFYQTQNCIGNPCPCPLGITKCGRSECYDHSECSDGLACRNGMCKNPCVGACGTNTKCEVRNHVAQCSCLPGYKGDPLTSCKIIDPCLPSPCGSNTKCKYSNGLVSCSCLEGYIGNPISGCRHECETDAQCGSYQMCSDFTCIPSCSTCSRGSICADVVNHRAICKCPPGYLGNPLSGCRTQCISNLECPKDRPVCNLGRCENPCIGCCGVNADCRLNGINPVCSCPADLTGNPNVYCRQFTIEDLCSQYPCGQNAICKAGYDDAGKLRPVCSCIDGYEGNPLEGCRHECDRDDDCPLDKKCRNTKCMPPCDECGKKADCSVVNHNAVCTCPAGYIGNPYIECKFECYGNSDCPLIRPVCKNGNCTNPCIGCCGVNAECSLNGYQPVCNCPLGMTGDPNLSCSIVQQSLCSPNPCGTNSLCAVGQDDFGKDCPVCSCESGFIAGSSSSLCIPGECHSDAECPDDKTCISNSCVDVCIGKCGLGATCVAQRHLASCICPPGSTGYAHISCSAQFRSLPLK